MKADFEKGTKVCSKCKKELPIEMFSKDKFKLDGLYIYCKYCEKEYSHVYNNKKVNTFNGKHKVRKGCSKFVKRDYELTDEQLRKRERNRLHAGRKPKNKNAHGILIWYDEKLNELNYESYQKIYKAEYNRQKACAIRGYIGRVKPSEHFIFDFDLEQMLKDNAYCKSGKNKLYITKWWNGEIRHWTVNDGIWKKNESKNK